MLSLENLVCPPVAAQPSLPPIIGTQLVVNHRGPALLYTVASLVPQLENALAPN